MEKVIIPNKVYEVKEAGEALNMNYQTVIEYCRKGIIKARKVKGWKILGQSLIDFIAK